MKRFTIEDIRSWEPCYDPSFYLPEDWEGTAIDILNMDHIPFNDRLWVVCREELVSAKTLRLFAVWLARQVQHLLTDQRSIDAIDVAEKYALGQANDQDLIAARAAAWAAARDARAAARAARAAAWAARAAAWAARAASAASAAAWVPRSATLEAQKNKLIEMILEENK